MEEFKDPERPVHPPLSLSTSRVASSATLAGGCTEEEEEEEEEEGGQVESWVSESVGGAEHA